MALNIINFSNGIRPEEIQDNFKYLQDQISRERASVGGSGIASGLEITVNVTDDTFNIEVSNGSIIDDEGEEVFVSGCTIEIDPPKLKQTIEYLNLSEDRTVTLNYKPYALNRRKPVEYINSFEPEYSGINIRYRNSLNQDDYIRVRNVLDRTVTVSGAISKELKVEYYYTAKRIDTLYLDENLEIKIKSGTTSTTPSAILPTDAKYLIAYLEIDNEYNSEKDTTPHAYIYVKDDLRTIRNLYTTKDGELYICGIPFDDLQIIHLQEPTNPKEFTLWLNLSDNTLYCWRSTDEFVYKNKIDVSTEFVENSNANYTFSTYMDFTLNAGELNVYLNDSILSLGRDYEEISKELPTVAANKGDNERGNSFRILQSIIRPDGYEDILIPGDVLTYTIKYKDSQYMWVPVNKQNYINVRNTKVYCTRYQDIEDKYLYDGQAYFDSEIANSLGINQETNYPHKYQYFLFNREEDLDMLFTPGRKELSVMVNQMYLHEDQFKEIQIIDLLEGTLPSEIISAANDFGWTNEYIRKNSTIDGEYFGNSGIGFMLVDPLDSGAEAETANNDWRTFAGSNDLFVEAIVEHRICSTPINRKLERSATFVSEDSIVVDDSFNGIVETNGKYRFDEHQLEVFVDGVKQIAGRDYIEQFGYFDENNKEISTDDIIYGPIDEDEEYVDQDYFIRKKSAVCTKFKFIKDVNMDAVVTYKITTNVYSYDHINNILDNIGDTLTTCTTIVNDFTNTMNDFREEVTSEVNTIKERVNEITSFDDEFLTHESILNIGQMPEVIVKNAIKSLDHINTFITLNETQTIYTLQDIWPEDYLNVFYHSKIKINDTLVINNDSYWVKGLHYRINTVGTTSCYLEILETTEFNTGDILYLSGIKLSGLGREMS